MRQSKMMYRPRVKTPEEGSDTKTREGHPCIPDTGPLSTVIATENLAWQLGGGAAEPPTIGGVTGHRAPFYEIKFTSTAAADGQERPNKTYTS